MDDSEQNTLVAKRPAFGELSPAPDAKRSKGLHDGLKDFKIQAAVRRVPFPEKVYKVL
jgi:hypothetical protein